MFPPDISAPTFLWPDPSPDAVVWVFGLAPVVEIDPRCISSTNEPPKSSGARAWTPDAEPGVLDLLAAAYAGLGRFAEAVSMARRALGLAEQQHKNELAEAIRARLRSYEAK